MHLPFHPVDLVDPTGGGDAFVGCLTALLAGGEPLDRAGAAASAAAGHTVARLGGHPRFIRADLRAAARRQLTRD